MLINNEWFEIIDPLTLEPALEEDTKIAKKLLDQHKLVYGELLSADIVFPEQAGIIKYMVDNELKVVRFGTITTLKVR